MALTKVTGQVINTSTDVTVGVLTVTNTLAVGGTVSIGGTLTYEDVTNIDSVGLITARNGIIVGSGITLSKDGDIFATGVTTATSFVGDGSQLTGVASTENIRTNTNATFLQNINVSGSTTTGSAKVGVDTGVYGENLVVTGNARVTGITTFGDSDNPSLMLNIDATSGLPAISIPDSIIHSGDTNTKIRFPAADTIQLETAGSERLKITSAGVIQCGTSGVLKAEINNAVSGHQFISQCDDNNNGFEVYQKHGSTTTRNTFAVYANTGAGASKEAQLLVRGDGKVLIGTGVTISESGIEASGIGITVANINGGAIGGRRNLIINGNFAIDQRYGYAEQNPAVHGQYYADRWLIHKQQANKFQIQTTSESLPANQGYPYALKCNVTNAVNPASTAGAYFLIEQPIEGKNILGLKLGSSGCEHITVQFWVRSSVTGTYSVAIRNSAYDSHVVNEYSISSANTWEKKVVTFANVITSGTWLTTNGVGLRLDFSLGAGSNFRTSSLNVLGSGSPYASSNDVNWINNANATFFLTGVQLEAGTQATAFEHRTFAEDYRDCLRYYYESRHDGNNFMGNGPNSYASGFLGFGLNAEKISASVRFPVPMRDIPSVTMIRPSDGSAGDAHIFRGVTGSNGASDVSFGAVTATDIGSHGFLYWSCASNVTQGATYLFHIIADSEL